MNVLRKMGGSISEVIFCNAKACITDLLIHWGFHSQRLLFLGDEIFYHAIDQTRKQGDQMSL
jgi:hypothetical protein